jgi:hypothetical protein
MTQRDWVSRTRSDSQPPQAVDEVQASPSRPPSTVEHGPLKFWMYPASPVAAPRPTPGGHSGAHFVSHPDIQPAVIHLKDAMPHVSWPRAGRGAAAGRGPMWTATARPRLSSASPIREPSATVLGSGRNRRAVVRSTRATSSAPWTRCQSPARSRVLRMARCRMVRFAMLRACTGPSGAYDCLGERPTSPLLRSRP